MELRAVGLPEAMAGGRASHRDALLERRAGLPDRLETAALARPGLGQ